MGSSKTTAAGRVVRIDMSYNEKGTAMTKWSMPIDTYNFKTKETETDWYNCVMFGTAAEHVGKYVKDGCQVLATGNLRCRIYPTKEKKPALSYDFKVESCEIIAFPPKSSSGSSSSKSTSVDYDMGDFNVEGTDAKGNLVPAGTPPVDEFEFDPARPF